MVIRNQNIYFAQPIIRSESFQYFRLFWQSGIYWHTSSFIIIFMFKWQKQKRKTKITTREKNRNKNPKQIDKQTRNVKCWIWMNIHSRVAIIIIIIMVFSEWKVEFHALNRKFCLCWQWRRNERDAVMRNNLIVFISKW